MAKFDDQSFKQGNQGRDLADLVDNGKSSHHLDLLLGGHILAAAAAAVSHNEKRRQLVF